MKNMKIALLMLQLYRRQYCHYLTWVSSALIHLCSVTVSMLQSSSSDIKCIQFRNKQLYRRQLCHLFTLIQCWYHIHFQMLTTVWNVDPWLIRKDTKKSKDKRNKKKKKSIDPDSIQSALLASGLGTTRPTFTSPTIKPSNNTIAVGK